MTTAETKRKRAAMLKDKYVAEYEMNLGNHADNHFGIQDHGPRGVMSDKKQFQVWHQGCGIGGFDTMMEAEAFVAFYGLETAKKNMPDLESRLEKVKKTIAQLGGVNAFRTADEDS